MPQWFDDLWAIAAAICGLWAVTSAWWPRNDLESTRILDWGPQPNRIRVVTSGVVGKLSFWWLSYQMVLKGVASWTEAIGYAVFSSCMAVCVVINALPHLGLYETGMRVSIRFFFGTRNGFIEWSKIKHYRWAEQGELLINPGWHQWRCLIPADHIADVDAVLKAKCPDGELPV